MRKYCPFTHWVSLLMSHHVRTHKPRIRARPPLLAAHQDFLWNLEQDILFFLWLIRPWVISERGGFGVICTRTLICTHMAHIGCVTLPSNKLHTSSGSSPPVWHLAQEKLTCMCQANARHKNQVAQSSLFCCLVLLVFPGFFLLLRTVVSGKGLKQFGQCVWTMFSGMWCNSWGCPCPF